MSLNKPRIVLALKEGKREKERRLMKRRQEENEKGNWEEGVKKKKRKVEAKENVREHRWRM